MMSDIEARGFTRLWRQLRLGQKMSLAVMASFIPLVLLGVQVANYSGGLLKDQTLDTVGLSASVEARRVQGEVQRARDELDKLAEDGGLAQSLMQQSDSNQIAGSNNNLENAVEDAFKRLGDSGLLALEIQVAGGTPFRSGNISPQSLL